MRCPREYLIEGRPAKGWQAHHKRVEAERKVLDRGATRARGVEKRPKNLPLTPRKDENGFCYDPLPVAGCRGILHDLARNGICSCGFNEGVKRDT